MIKTVFSIGLVIGVGVSQPHVDYANRPERSKSERVKAERKAFDPKEVIESQDADGDSALNFEEFQTLEKNQVLPDEVVRKLFSRFDKNEDGLIDVTEIPPLPKSGSPERGRHDHKVVLMRIFNRWDTNEDQFLSAEEFGGIQGKFSEKFEFSELDVDGDAQLSLRELAKSMMELRHRDFGSEGQKRPQHPPFGRRLLGTHFLEKIDADRDGMFTREELTAASEEESLHRLSNKLLEAFDDIDSDQNGSLDQNERAAYINTNLLEKGGRAPEMRRDGLPPHPPSHRALREGR